MRRAPPTLPRRRPSFFAAMCGILGLAERPAHTASKYGAELPAMPPGGQAPGAGSFHRSGDDRLWLFARAWEPADKTKVRATLMILHGTVDHSGVYGELAERLVEKGVAVFAMDMRGWGLSDGEPLYFHDVEVFASDVFDYYNRIHGEGSPYAAVKSRFLCGKSLGGLIAAWAATSEPEKWTGLVGLSGAFQVADGVRPNPALKALRAIDELPARLQGFRLPVLMLWGTGDRVVSEGGHEMMYKASSDERSRFIKYDGGFHNLLAEPSLKEKVIADIDGWIATIAALSAPTKARRPECGWLPSILRTGEGARAASGAGFMLALRVFVQRDAPAPCLGLCGPRPHRASAMLGDLSA
eukprot:CAMPEP_0170234700 /NCGR_PEP_ID=MMETSP0116_2-20130129/17095_1 /TAXON_ID=400756 /ORGANISM="Durinskia baltica, Strain CSIRO CS-38" /LENGTH=354 /DNA_ID=CAMNT_0010485493 /DNA_START=6 /DNA_END=1068 /DNA_ORIENTATION=-